MQAAKLPMQAGLGWIQEGWTIFKKQPLPIFMWSLFIGFLINMSYAFLVIGQLVLFVITPSLTFITLSACKRVLNQEKLTLNTWFKPISTNREVRSSLLKLGFVYLIFCVGAALVASLPFLGQFNNVIDDQGHINDAALIAAMSGPMITFGLLYVLVSAFFWHAPALIGWHNIKMSQAMFYSMIACWRNKLPFLVYGICWAAMFYGLYMVTSTMIHSGAGASVTQFLLTPVNLIMVAVLYCSFYPAYMSVFGANYQNENNNL